MSSRSQAESYIKLGQVTVDGKVVAKPGFLVGDEAAVAVTAKEQYVNRAALKLASVAKTLNLNFKDKVVLDVGSSTGGFTEYALRQGAQWVIAVDVGTDQLHPSLRGNERIELHEQTDIRKVRLRRAKPQALNQEQADLVYIDDIPDVVVADVSFISLRQILPSISQLVTRDSLLVCMVKPQFEAINGTVKHHGVIKNDRMRRDILKDFEAWTTGHGFVIKNKADSSVAGSKGNIERFYLLQQARKS